MKPIRLFFILFMMLSTTALSASSNSWELVCSKGEKECRSLWSQSPIPDTNGNIVVAYNVHHNLENQPIVSFVVNINRVNLHPNVDMIIVYTSKDNVLPIPIAARDATGVTAAFDNAVTISKLLDKMLDSEKLNVSFMQEGLVENTTIAIPLEEFKEKLKSMPHGEETFTQKMPE